ncbi:MAG: hypothetical protein ACTIOI_02665 [Pseudomonas helleri]|uniref:hypothetical protein n=1 Tax=Pseudomonas helleri TaxID=1608996 RepID=UPI003F97B854
MTLPIHQSDVELLVRVVSGTSLKDLADEAKCTPPNISRKVKRIKERLSWVPAMTVEQIRERAAAVKFAGRSTGPEVLRLIAECESLRADAIRYRYMRDFPYNNIARAVGVCGGNGQWLQFDEADKAVDKAMRDDEALRQELAQ